MLVGSMGVNSLRLPTGLVTWERFVSRRRDRGGAMLLSRLVGPRHSEVLEDAVPEPGAGQILVEIEACGICASELETWKGFSPKGLGHEPAGVVREVGEGAARCGLHGTVRGFARVLEMIHGRRPGRMIAASNLGAKGGREHEPGLLETEREEMEP
jgi:hypothetical protein